MSWCQKIVNTKQHLVLVKLQAVPWRVSCVPPENRGTGFPNKVGFGASPDHDSMEQDTADHMYVDCNEGHVKSVLASKQVLCSRCDRGMTPISCMMTPADEFPYLLVSI